MRYLLRIFLLATIIIYSISCAHRNPYEPNHNLINHWENSFDCENITDCIKKKSIRGIYDKAFPVDDFWTYATIQPEGANLEIIQGNDNKYLRCYVPSAKNSLTSKAQICRKFSPAGIDNSYTGMTAFFEEDVLIISMKIFIEHENIYEGNVYFLDIEDSTTDSAGVRYIIRSNNMIGINRDKIMSKDPIIYTNTTIPTDKWFTFKTEIKISEENGYYKIWIDDKKVLDQSGLSFIKELHMYDSVMAGITGTRINDDYQLFIDDFRIEVIRNSK